MRTLGLDISTVATGWALFEGDQLIKWGVIKTDKDMNITEKYFYVTHSVITLLKIYRPNFLSIEDTFLGRDPVTFKKLNRIAGQIIYAWFSYTRTEPSFYMASAARKSVGINGKSTKTEVTQGVNEIFKLRGRIKDDNIADAIVVGYCDVATRVKERKTNVRSRRRSSRAK